MRRTLHKTTGEALEAYPKGERSRWILEWPGQLVLNCSQVRWPCRFFPPLSVSGFFLFLLLCLGFVFFGCSSRANRAKTIYT